jgi:hypothetical protein
MKNSLKGSTAGEFLGPEGLIGTLDMMRPARAPEPFRGVKSSFGREGEPFFINLLTPVTLEATECTNTKEL